MESSFLCHLPNSSQLKYCNVVISLQSNHRQLNRRIAARLSNEIYAKFWLNFQLGGVLVSSAFILLLVQQEWNNIRFQIGEQLASQLTMPSIPHYLSLSPLYSLDRPLSVHLSHPLSLSLLSIHCLLLLRVSLQNT